jgi:hypothetical protein
MNKGAEKAFNFDDEEELSHA